MQRPTFHLDELGNTATAVFAVNERHAIETWNRGAEALFGRPASSVIGRICHTLIRGRLPSGKGFCGDRCPLVKRVRRNECLRDLELLAEDGRGCHLLLTFSTITLASTAHVVHLVRPAVRSDGNGVQIAQLTAPSLADVTRREADVLRALASGASTLQTATQLSISPLTVRTHIRNLLRKKNLHSQRQLALFAVRSGLVSGLTASRPITSF
jgi:DNA-binding CsgD family transcriptional regulator